jgi:DNA replication protein DnaC
MDKAERDRFSNARKGENLMEPLYGCDLLILDDVGAEFRTSFTVSQLYNIINNRMLNRLPTIINTNSDIEELRELYGERTTSRLMTYVILPFAGNDIRQILRKY